MGGWFVLGARSGPGWGGGLAGWVKGKYVGQRLADDVEHLHLLHPAHFQLPHPLGA